MNINRFFALILLVISCISTLNAETFTTYYSTDHLGTPSLSSNIYGDVTSYDRYTPFGDRVATPESAVINSDETIGYTGHGEDRIVDLTYMGARYYDSDIGRFYSNDPIGFVSENPLSFNRYSYANNSPFVFIDPDGQYSYLVSRPLGIRFVGGVASHNFIVTNAESLGDPNATVYSYGNNGEGIMGRVTKSTTGPAATTYQTDVDSWLSLAASGNNRVTYRQIDAADATVESYALSLLEDQKYEYVPEMFGGVNSNSAAGAIAHNSDSSFSLVIGGTIEPGASVASKVNFDERSTYMCVMK